MTWSWFANLLRGEIDGAPVALYDYGYATGSGSGRHDYDQTVACFHIGKRVLPGFVLQPR